jgi:crotonobetainyl-CoA:carnitine CoA-transferase CaiB-like acyl-CoA transferase
MRPLADVRILALEQFGAGPWGSMQLADLGAEVIKLEDPSSGGDVGRYVPPFQTGEDSLFFESFNRNKKSLDLDLRRPEARGVFEDLVRHSDAVYSNLRGDQPRRLGLTYDDLKAVNPRIVCCSLSGYGMTGPRAAEGGYDYMMQGLAGWMSLTGDPDAPPTKSGLSLVDFNGGYVAAIAILAGLLQARRDGAGCDCDIALLETALSELTYVGTWTASAGHVPQRHANSAHPSIVPFQNFASADGWLVVACPKQKFWTRLCEVIGRPELAADPRFRGFAERLSHRDALLEILDAEFRARSTDDWLEALANAGVPCAPINDVPTALTDPQITARGGVLAYEHPTLGTVRQAASPLRLGGEAAPMGRAPRRGEHTIELLSSVCGYSDERLHTLASCGVFGDPPEVQPTD